MVTETKLDDKVTQSALSIPGYLLIRQDRNANGGGVAMYIKEEWNPCQAEDIQELYVKEGLEVIVATIGKGPLGKRL